MLSDRGFFGPSQYHFWVLYLVVGVLLVAMIVAWYLVVVRYTRRAVPREAVVRPPSPGDLRQLKAKYEGLIDEVEAEHRADRLPDRAIHSRLSLLVRFFVFETSGVDAHVMTLADLRENRLPQLAGAVGEFYPPAFRVEEPGDPQHAVATARELVRSWA